MSQQNKTETTLFEQSEMEKKIIYRIVLINLLLLFTITSCVPTPAEIIERQEDEIEKLKDDIDDLEIELEDLQSNYNELVNRLSEINDLVSSAQSSLDEVYYYHNTYGDIDDVAYKLRDIEDLSNY